MKFGTIKGMGLNPDIKASFQAKKNCRQESLLIRCNLQILRNNQSQRHLGNPTKFKSHGTQGCGKLRGEHHITSERSNVARIRKNVQQYNASILVSLLPEGNFLVFERYFFLYPIIDPSCLSKQNETS